MKVEKIKKAEMMDLDYPSEMNFISNIIQELTEKIVKKKQSLLRQRIMDNECEGCVISVYTDDDGHEHYTAEKESERIRLITFIETPVKFDPFESARITMKREFKYY